MGSNGKEIRQLEEASVRRIVAEQAVTDLASVVKELVDNALDAQSTSINSKYPIDYRPAMEGILA
jgi:DNA mismatch repair ATPase MutL